jgi:predicted Zn-dependent peptidase
MQRQLDFLYGSYLNADVFKLGERQIVQFRLELPNGKYIPGKPELLKAGIAFLQKVLMEPVREGGAFKASFVELEKEALRKRVEGLFNNKSQYARIRCVEHMCPDEPYRLFSGGRIEDLAGIDPQVLEAEYAALLRDGQMDMFVVGDVNPETVAEELRAVLPFDGHNARAQAVESCGQAPAAPRVITEHAEVNQGQLVMGLRAPVRYDDPGYYAMMMYNGVLGGFAHSKLFVHVRERESLAYSARSRYDAHKGMLFVQAGIDIQNHDRAVAVINEQIAAIQAGEITDQELDQTRAMLINTYREAYDSPGALINLAFESIVGGRERSIDELAAAVPAIGKAEIIEASQKLTMDTAYFLRDPLPAAEPQFVEA